MASGEEGKEEVMEMDQARTDAAKEEKATQNRMPIPMGPDTEALLGLGLMSPPRPANITLTAGQVLAYVLGPSLMLCLVPSLSITWHPCTGFFLFPCLFLPLDHNKIPQVHCGIPRALPYAWHRVTLKPGRELPLTPQARKMSFCVENGSETRDGHHLLQ